MDSLLAEPQRKPKNTGVCSLSFLQPIFLTQDSNQGLLHCRWILYKLSYEGSPIHIKGLPKWYSGKESAFKAGDLSSIPRSGRSPGKGNDNLFQYSCLENPMDRRAWKAIVYGDHKVGQDWVTNTQPYKYTPDSEVLYQKMPNILLLFYIHYMLK